MRLVRTHRSFVRPALEKPHRTHFPRAQEQACQHHVEPRVGDGRHYQGADEERRGENLRQRAEATSEPFS